MDIKRVPKQYLEEIEFLSFVFSLRVARRMYNDNATFNTFVVNEDPSDTCQKHTKEECEDPCFWNDIPYHKVECINKNRKKYLHANGEIKTAFKGSDICNPPLSFTILDTNSVESASLGLILEGTTAPSIHLYYRIIFSNYSGITYIGFNSGIIIKDNDYIHKIKPICDQLIPYFESLSGPLCICGWSMGGSFALGLAYHWIHRNPEFFEHVKCVVLCPFKVLPDDSIHGWPNIKQYVNKDDEKDLMDPFLNKGGDRNVPFSPSIVISSTSKEIDLYPDGPDELHTIDRYTRNIIHLIRRTGGRRRKTKRRSRRYTENKILF